MEQTKVYSIKLISGEEIVARINKQTDDVTELNKPRALVMGPQGFSMIPWMMSAPDSNIIISNTTIAGATETSSMISTQYIKHVTGLQV